MAIKVFSFFSGVGFLDLGFENAGFDIAFVNEVNIRFLESYKYARRNDQHVPEYGYSFADVRDFLIDSVWESTFPDYLHDQAENIIGFIGGPPCPDFSIAGKNAGEKGINGQLTSVYVNLIIKRAPAFFILENVKGLFQTQKHKDFYARMKKKLYRAGYSLFDSVESALTYGVPQDRERLVLIGIQRKRFGSHIHLEIGQHRRFTETQIRNSQWPTVDPYVTNGFRAMPPNIIEELTVQYWFTQNDVLNHPNAQDVFAVKSRERFETIPEGNSSGKSFKRLHRWRYSPTAAYGNNEVHLHPYMPRRISVAEALAIQSIPAFFSLPSHIPLSLKFKMVGNGVPYLLALGLASDINDWLHNEMTVGRFGNE